MDIGGNLEDVRFYRCPIAVTGHPEIMKLIQMYRRHRSGLIPLPQQVGQPSAALTEAMIILEDEGAALREYELVKLTED